MFRYPHTLASAIALVTISQAAVSAQEREIACDTLPAAVSEAFSKTFPEAVVKSCVEEVQEGETVYEISSTDGEAGLDVIFDAEGELVVEERTISPSDIPPLVMEAVQKRFPNGKITLIESVKEGDELRYEFRITDQGKEELIEFDAKGGEVKP